MANNTLTDVVLTGAWQDLVATHAGLAGVAATIQNVGHEEIAIVYGGAGVPADRSGVLLGRMDTTTGAAANVWARSLGAAGRVSVTLN